MTDKKGDTLGTASNLFANTFANVARRSLEQSKLALDRGSDENADTAFHKASALTGSVFNLMEQADFMYPNLTEAENGQLHILEKRAKKGSLNTISEEELQRLQKKAFEISNP